MLSTISVPGTGIEECYHKGTAMTKGHDNIEDKQKRKKKVNWFIMGETNGGMRCRWED